MHRSASHESITQQKVSAPGHKRVSSREAPPSAHQNRHGLSPNPRTHPEMNNEDKRGLLFGGGRSKSQPPVAMQTQGRTLPVPLRGSHPPNRAPPNPPAQEDKKEIDPWAAQRDYWTSRKQDAVSLKSRRSTEITRPKSSSQQQPLTPTQGILIKRPESAGQSSDTQRSGWLKKRVSFEGTPLSRSESEENFKRRFKSWDTSGQRWDGYGTSTQMPYNPASPLCASYDHMYGSYDYVRPQHQQQREEEYYDSPSQIEDDFAIHAQTLRRDSTQDMLSFDPGYGYGMGNQGRKSSSIYSDVPVLPRMRVQS
jgi:hypothetical protein